MINDDEVNEIDNTTLEDAPEEESQNYDTHPEWYLKAWDQINDFHQKLPEEKALLVQASSELTGALIISLTPQGKEMITNHGVSVFGAVESAHKSQFAAIPDGHKAYFLIGVLVEALGIKQMIIDKLKANSES